MCNWTLEVRDTLKNIVEKRRNCSLGAISPLFHNIFYILLDFHVKAGTRFSLRDKRLFEISEVEITRVNCMSPPPREENILFLVQIPLACASYFLSCLHGISQKMTYFGK